MNLVVIGLFYIYQDKIENFTFDWLKRLPLSRFYKLKKYINEKKLKIL